MRHFETLTGLGTSHRNRLFLLFVFARLRTPIDKARPEIRHWKDHREAGAIGVNLEQSEQTVILQAKHNPAPIGRIGTDEGVYVTTRIVSYKTQMCSVGADRRDVGGHAWDMSIPIFAEDYVLTVGRPVLFNRHVEI